MGGTESLPTVSELGNQRRANEDFGLSVPGFLDQVGVVEDAGLAAPLELVGVHPSRGSDLEVVQTTCLWVGQVAPTQAVPRPAAERPDRTT